MKALAVVPTCNEAASITDLLCRSHPPERIPALLDTMREADVAIGSRYVPGDRTEHWSRARAGLSRAGNRVAGESKMDGRIVIEALVRVTGWALTGGRRRARAQHPASVLARSTA